MKNKAFTLVEIMIVIVIIGLLAAMAIPAFTKVRDGRIAKAILHGENLSDSDRRIAQAWTPEERAHLLHADTIPAEPKKWEPTEYKTVITNNESVISSAILQKLSVNGKTYILVPQNTNMKTIEVEGKTFWLAPEKE